MKRKVMYRVQLTIEAKHALEAICDTNAHRQNDFCERLLTWFAAAPDYVQRHAMGLLPKRIEPAIATILMKRRR